MRHTLNIVLKFAVLPALAPISFARFFAVLLPPLQSTPRWNVCWINTRLKAYVTIRRRATCLHMLSRVLLTCSTMVLTSSSGLLDAYNI